KCLQKEPARRYATARDLADDLGRFLDGEPIRARPVGRAERLGRWCRRRPVVAALAAALLLAGGGGGAGGRHQRGGARWERARARADLAEAERQKAQAEKSWHEAERQRARARRTFEQARAAINDFCRRVSEGDPALLPGGHPLRKELLESALRYYQEFIAD